jgi:HTH DNA binding domain
MLECPEEPEELRWRPAWEADPVEETAEKIDPPGAPRVRKAELDDAHPLLGPLARAQDAVARLEARAEAASPAVTEGLRARLALREAAGWLSQAHVAVHPQDLALRDSGMTGSYSAAALTGRLDDALPATTAQGADFEAPPPDAAVDQALRLARLWRRLAEFRSWRPLADGAAVREALAALGCRGAYADTDIEDWRGLAHRRDGVPALIGAARAARDWMNRPWADPRSLDGVFLAACLWREKGFGRTIPLPFWSAREVHHNRLGLRFGGGWLAGFLECVADAARTGADELVRLRRAEENGRSLPGTARSRLPDALEVLLRSPVVTARGLAKRLDVTPQAALGLIRQLCEAGVAREATGRASWRAFIIS